MSLLERVLPHGPLVLDASVIINLLGSGHIDALVPALGAPCAVPFVARREVLRNPLDGSDPEPVLSALTASGALVISELSEEEYDDYLGLISGDVVSVLDDGEASAIAMALRRGWPIALDDGKARRRARELSAELVVCSSLQCIVAAGERCGMHLDAIRSAVQAARTVSRMNIVRGDEALLQALGVTG